MTTICDDLKTTLNFHGRLKIWILSDSRLKCAKKTTERIELGLPVDLKTVARCGYDWRTNAREKFLIMRKWVQSLCAPLRSFRSELKKIFYHSILPHAL